MGSSPTSSPTTAPTAAPTAAPTPATPYCWVRMPTGCHRALTEIPNWTINVSTPWFIDPNAYNETHCRDRTLNTPGFNQYCARTDGQWWYGVNPYDLAPDNVYIPNRHGGLCLDAKRRRSNNSKVHMWPCDQTICRDESN